MGGRRKGWSKISLNVTCDAVLTLETYECLYIQKIKLNKQEKQSLNFENKMKKMNLNFQVGDISTNDFWVQ